MSSTTKGLFRSTWRDPFFGLLMLVLFFGPVMLAPHLARSADRVGLPGELLALLVILVAPSIAVLHVHRERPEVRRARAMRRVAAGSGLSYVSVFKPPASLMTLPALGGPADFRGYDGGLASGFSNLLSGRREDVNVMVFDFWTENAAGPYTRPQWRTCVATQTGLECPQLIVQPRTPLPRTRQGFREMRSESASFDDRYRVLTADQKFATALMDGRMIAFILDSHPSWAFEVAGGWAAIVTDELPPGRIDTTIQALMGFRAHQPRVMKSLYPPAGPHFA